jgi:hypothetical protein
MKKYASVLHRAKRHTNFYLVKKKKINKIKKKTDSEFKISG